MAMSPGVHVRVAVVGCGTISERQHIPRLAERDDIEIVALVDRNQVRAESLAARFEIPTVLADYTDVSIQVADAAIIALPNHLHAPASIQLLQEGIHVLVEKPMALTVDDCDAMLAAAESGNAVLAVGLARRFSHMGRFTKEVVESGLLGRIVSFDIQSGFVFNWPTASDYLLRRETAGGGVLMDSGVHAVDQLLWWLGDMESFTYYDDSFGGVEADCKICARLQSGAEGIVELSRTRDLGDTSVIQGERAELRVTLKPNSVSLRPMDGVFGFDGKVEFLEDPQLSDQSSRHLFALQHEDFLAAIRNGRPPAVSGSEGRRSVALIQACYEARRTWDLPWVVTSPDHGKGVEA